MADVVAEEPKLTLEQAVQRANEHWNAGQAPHAELLCRRILEVSPRNADAHHLLGLIAHAYQNHDGALEHLRLACDAPRLPALYVSNLAEVCRQKRLYDEAETAARRAVAIDPNLAKAQYTLGIILQERGAFSEALEWLKRVALTCPDDFDCLNALANTYLRLGDYRNAESFYRNVIERNPGHAEALSNLSFLYASQGSYEAAGDAARRAIDIQPAFHGAYLNLAQAELGQGRHREALAVLDSLHAFAPRHAPGLVARSSVLHAQEHFRRAEECACAAIAIAPKSAEAHLAAARACQSLGETTKALAYYQQASDLPGTIAESALAGQAATLLEAGRRDEAFASLDRALEIFPSSVRVLSIRADAKTFRENDSDIGKLRGIAAQGEARSIAERVKVNFSLGKAHLDIGATAEAFRYFKTANALKRSTFNYDSAATKQWMDQIATSFSIELIKRLAGSGADSRAPVFIIGMPRSGTSLVEQILASNHKVVGAGELSAFGTGVAELGPYPHYAPGLTGPLLKALGERYLEKVSTLGSGAERVIDKMPGNFLYAGLIALALPGARIIHCRRDAVDTCLSCYTREFAGDQRFAYDMTELGEFYGYYERLMTHWREVLPASQFTEVRYEDVICDLEGEARALSEFIGVGWDDSCLAFYESKRVVRTASYGQVRQPLYSTSIGRWQEYQSELTPLLAALGAAR